MHNLVYCVTPSSSTNTIIREIHLSSSFYTCSLRFVHINYMIYNAINKNMSIMSILYEIME